MPGAIWTKASELRPLNKAEIKALDAVAERQSKWSRRRNSALDEDRVALQIDSDIIFRLNGPGKRYQPQVNSILRSLMELSNK